MLKNFIEANTCPFFFAVKTFHFSKKIEMVDKIKPKEGLQSIFGSVLLITKRGEGGGSKI